MSDFLASILGPIFGYMILGGFLHGFWEVFCNPFAIMCVAVGGCILAAGYGHFSKEKIVNIVMFWVATFIILAPMIVAVCIKLAALDHVPFWLFILFCTTVVITVGSCATIFTREYSGLRYYSLSFDNTSRNVMCATKELYLKAGDFVRVRDESGYYRTALVVYTYGEIEDAWPPFCPKIQGLATWDEGKEWVKMMRYSNTGEMDPRVRRLIQRYY